MKFTRSAGFPVFRPLLLVSLFIFSSFMTTAHASAPGGFMESDETSVTRAPLTATQISAFMPSRGAFTFPAPYNTQGWRLTNASDCGGNDCVDYIGYSYWRNMSNSTGSNIMYIFVGLDKRYGGAGPTLFELDKSTGVLTKVGPLFPSSSPYSNFSGEGWYFSYSMPTKLYLLSSDLTALMRYDVVSHQMTQVFSVSSQYPGDSIFQCNTSNDDQTDACTLKDSSYQPLGCVVYQAGSGKLTLYPKTGSFDECQIDKSGNWLVIKEKTPTTCSTCDVDNIIVNLQTGQQTLLSDQDGAGGHSDLGYGYYLAADNWNNYPGAMRLWNLAQSPLLGSGNGGLVFHDLSWSADTPGHVSFENAKAGVPIYQQYACGSAINSTNPPHANEIFCFMLDTSVPLQSEQVLVVAPNISSLSASGGGSSYAKQPKGNLDPTGQYFIWTANLDGNRLDAFIVKIPYQVMTNGSSVGGTDTTPPTVGITQPAADATVSGTVTVSANASDNVAVANVQFLLDGNALGTPVTQAPYAISWNTANAATGLHTLSAIATDTSNNTADAQAVTVTVAKSSSTSTTPSVSMMEPPAGSTVSGTVTVSANVSSNTTISKVQFKLDGQNLGNAVTQSPYQVSWNAGSASPGSHTLSAVAITDSGLSSTSSPDTITVESTTNSSNSSSSSSNGSKGGGSLGLSILAILLGFVLLLARQRKTGTRMDKETSRH